MATEREQFNQRAIENFRKYLRIPSVHPNIDYSDCVDFLKQQAEDLKLACKVVQLTPKKPVVIITWTGTQPNLPSILLNSHMDVVPVYEEKWTQKPFAADIVDGKIYARGSQDMKCVGMQYLEAVRLLKQKGVKLRRTLNITFVPDEEIGGAEGMKKFVQTEEFKKLNVGFGMDEAVFTKEIRYAVFYAERSTWQLQIRCTGLADHGASVKRNHAAEKLTKMLNKIYEFRSSEVAKHEPDPEAISEADIISMNVTIIKGGVQANVVPSEFTCTVDCRIPPKTNIEEFNKMLDKWCEEAGEGVSYKYDRQEPVPEPTKIDDTNHFWTAFKAAADKLDLKLRVMVCPGGTDARYLRQLNIPALGFTPVHLHERLLHGHDEYITVEAFLKGIDIYCEVISSIGNV